MIINLVIEIKPMVHHNKSSYFVKQHKNSLEMTYRTCFAKIFHSHKTANKAAEKICNMFNTYTKENIRVVDLFATE